MSCSDMHGVALAVDDVVRFHAATGTKMLAAVTGFPAGGKRSTVEILINKDPFPVIVHSRRIEKVDRMSTDNEKPPTLKELRRTARNSGVKDWESLGREELTAVIKQSVAPTTEDESEQDSTQEEAVSNAVMERKSRSSSKTVSKPKASTVKSTARRAPVKPQEPVIPFREGTNLWFVTEELMKGGERKQLIKNLRPKMDFKPRTKDEADFNVEAEIDRRLKAIGYILKSQHGWDYTCEGRGLTGYIQATPPTRR